MRDDWRNSTDEPDAEMLAIDAIAERLTPLDEDTVHIRRLITQLEMCHHKAERLAEKIGRYLDASRMWNTGEVIETESGGEDKEFRDLTAQAVIHDTVNGRPAEITLAAAIDHFECCDWNFANNLEIVLRAIGGDLRPDKPFAACGRNIKLTPIRERMRVVSNTLTAFCDGTEPESIDRDILATLGDRTPVKHWLAACLGKTMRSQLGL